MSSLRPWLPDARWTWKPLKLGHWLKRLLSGLTRDLVLDVIFDDNAGLRGAIWGERGYVHILRKLSLRRLTRARLPRSLRRSE